MTSETDGESGEALKEERPRPSRRRRWIWLLVIALLVVGGYWFFVARKRVSPGRAGQRAPTAPAVVPVVAVEAKRGDIGIHLSGLGSVTPLNTVTVRTRVDGQLLSVHYKEGQIVTEGDLLAELDPRPFQAQLQLAQGQLARDQALLQNARRDLKRYRTLVKQDSIARQQYDTQGALVRQYEGAIKADEGSLASAQVQLIYTRVHAPITGRVGLRLVDPGNIVHASDPNGLVVITQLQPISVLFTIPEDSLPPVLRKLEAGEPLPVDAFNRDMSQKLASGSLLTMDNLIDPSTGTIKLKAIFENSNNELFPNQFVNARLLVDVLRGVTLVPTAAVQRSLERTFVFVVKPDQTVEVRDVKAGPGEGDLVSIASGLEPGERVVVDGTDKLRAGSKVVVRPPTGADGGSAP